MPFNAIDVTDKYYQKNSPKRGVFICPLTLWIKGLILSKELPLGGLFLFSCSTNILIEASSALLRILRGSERTGIIVDIL